MLKRFLTHNSGNVASMFAIAALPLVGATGAAVDYSRAYEQRMVVQDALDSAALAATKLLGTKTDAQILAEAQAFYLANVAGKFDNPPTFTMNITRGQVTLNTRLSVPTTLLGVMGIDDIAFDIMSRTIAGSATYEIALVLDNSTSMSGSKISTLLTAAKDLVNTVYAANVSNPKTDPVKFAIVPFGASVNVGTGNRTATWMGTGAETAGRSENFWRYVGGVKTNILTNRFTLFDRLTNVDWGGCVEERRMPYDVDDTAATAAVPDTMFIPMFAPDEPDDSTCKFVTTTSHGRSTTTWTCTAQSYEFPNNYLSDYGGARGQVAYTDRPEAQANVDKYTNVAVSSSYDGAGEGANLNCTTKPIMALTTSQSTTIAKINTLVANGYTNIVSGVTWGWRVLSPTAPFSEGRADTVVDNHKIMILMTDGANTYDTISSTSNFNRSVYAARSFIANNHLGTTSRTESDVVTKANDRTLLACQNLRNNSDITVYTIAFQLTNDATKQILRDCASDPAKAFDSQSNAQLLTAFRTIAEDITTLRIAE